MIRLLPILASAIAVSAAAQQPGADRLDPRSDGEWRAEALAATAGERLGGALKALIRGEPVELADLLAPGARSSRLVPPEANDPELAADAALRRWAEVFRGDEARTKVKLLSAELADGELVTRARIEAFGGPGGRGGGERVVQQVASWRVAWVVGESDELAVREIRGLGGEQREADAIWFSEITSAVLPRSLRARRELRLGGEYWPEHVDRVGETTRMGHQGLALGDVDGDGLEDLYVAMPNGLPNLLVRQRADGTFEDIAAAAGVALLDDTKGVLLLDMDGDGDDDLLAAIGPFVLLGYNDGDATFSRFLQMRAPTGGAFYHLAACDYDRDGDLDVYGCRYVEEAWATSVPMPYHDANNGPANVLFRNDGDAGFVDATAAVGLDANNARFSTAAAWADYDDDGDQDLYVSNDFGRNNLYRNDGGRFTDVAAAAGVEDQAAGMGVAFADVDGDLDLDLYVTNMFSSAGHRIASQDRFQPDMDAAERAALRALAVGNSLFLNRGDGTFERAADAAVRMGRWGWGARFVDLDGDGREDIVAPNGFLTGAQSAADC